jgi:hypothetical protein
MRKKRKGQGKRRSGRGIGRGGLKFINYNDIP